MAKDGAIKFI